MAKRGRSRDRVVFPRPTEHVPFRDLSSRKGLVFQALSKAHFIPHLFTANPSSARKNGLFPRLVIPHHFTTMPAAPLTNISWTGTLDAGANLHTGQKKESVLVEQVRFGCGPFRGIELARSVALPSQWRQGAPSGQSEVPVVPATCARRCSALGRAFSGPCGIRSGPPLCPRRSHGVIRVMSHSACTPANRVADFPGKSASAALGAQPANPAGFKFASSFLGQPPVHLQFAFESVYTGTNNHNGIQVRLGPECAESDSECAQLEAPYPTTGPLCDSESPVSSESGLGLRQRPPDTAGLGDSEGLPSQACRCAATVPASLSPSW
jgi:hypothetical protein